MTPLQNRKCLSWFLIKLPVLTLKFQFGPSNHYKKGLLQADRSTFFPSDQSWFQSQKYILMFAPSFTSFIYRFPLFSYDVDKNFVYTYPFNLFEYGFRIKTRYLNINWKWTVKHGRLQQGSKDVFFLREFYYTVAGRNTGPEKNRV